MRPKKEIVCVARHEFVLSPLVFVLETRGFRVHRAASEDEARALLQRLRGVAAVLLCYRTGTYRLAEEARIYDGELRTVVVAREDVRMMNSSVVCDAFFPSSVDMQTLIERVHVLAARKRGPKRQSCVLLDA